MPFNNTISEAALRYVGTKFLHRGRTTRGIDCVGLVILAVRDCGFVKELNYVYGREPRAGMLQAILTEHLGKPLNRAVEINDIVVMALSGGQPSHVGIITKHPSGLGIVHAYGEVGRVVHQRLDDRRRKQITGVYTWQEKY